MLSGGPYTRVVSIYIYIYIHGLCVKIFSCGRWVSTWEAQCNAGGAGRGGRYGKLYFVKLQLNFIKLERPELNGNVHPTLASPKLAWTESNKTKLVFSRSQPKGSSEWPRTSALRQLNGVLDPSYVSSRSRCTELTSFADQNTDNSNKTRRTMLLRRRIQVLTIVEATISRC